MRKLKVSIRRLKQQHAAKLAETRESCELRIRDILREQLPLRREVERLEVERVLNWCNMTALIHENEFLRKKLQKRKRRR